MWRMRCIVSFLFGYFLIGVISGKPTWRKMPKSVAAPLGGNVTLHCEINDLGSRSVIWHDSKYTIYFTNDRKFNAPDRYSIQGEYNLVITNITREDNKEFMCNVENVGIASANLTVLLPPGPPAIQSNTSGTLKENRVISLTCSSRGGNPSPTITWLKNSKVIFENYVYSAAQTLGGVASSQLTIVLDRTDHEANYTCVVSNPVNKDNPFKTFQILQVQYSPHITFLPYDPLNVRLGKNTDIRCIVDANPPVNTVTWRKNGRPLPGVSKTRTFRPTVKTDSGDYMCIANNNVNGPRNGTVRMEVMYPPIITIPTSMVVTEADRINITCQYDANPLPYEVHWERVGRSQVSVQNGPFLLFNRIHRGDAGNYTCKTYSQLKVSGETSMNTMEQSFTYINVEYPPGSAFIKPVGDFNVGDTVELKCSADPVGYPPAEFEWKKDGVTQSQDTATFRINSAQLSNIGNYECTPFNKVGRGQTNVISLSINEPPRLIESPNNAEIHVPLTDTNLLEIKCIAQGRPSPVITWYKNDDNITLTTMYPNLYTIEKANTTVNEYSYKVTTILYFKGSGRNRTKSGNTQLKVGDIGTYSCQVQSSAHAAILKGQASVLVQFKPQISDRQQHVAIDMSGTAKLPCITYANPNPTFIWYRNSVQITQGGRFSILREKLDNTAKFQSILSIRSVQQADLGGYTCVIRNSFGNATKNIRLTLKSPPEPPTNLRLVGKTWESVALKWDPGFDGGSRQDFFVQYSVGETDRDIKVNDGSTAINVTRLTPHTSYLFFVYGKNHMGKGQLSEGIPVQTNELVIPLLGVTPKFDVGSKKLSVPVVLDPMYCLRVEVQLKKQSQWEVEHTCVELLNEVIEVSKPGVSAMNVSVCLRYRYDVCGPPMKVELDQSEQGLTETHVIIIACVCAIIIVTLLTILICFIFRRKRNQAKEYEAESSTRQSQPVNGSVANQQKPPQGYDNADGPLELKRNGQIPNRGGQLRQNGHVPHDTSYDSQIEKQIFENEMNRRNENNSKAGRPGELQFQGIPRSPTKDKYAEEERKDGSLQSGQESGYSTPDPNKPKKVIYEVVV